MDVVRPDTELLVVTENGYGKRTPIEEYPRKGRGAMGVKTIGLTEKKGGVAGALIVRDHQELVFISQNGMVQRIAVRDIRPLGRNAQGFRLMNIRDEDAVSAVALVVESEGAAGAPVDDLPMSLDASGTASDPVAGDEHEIDPAGDDDALLLPPELSNPEMPDSDVEAGADGNPDA
jgi:DNA gyrase subunit A